MGIPLKIAVTAIFIFGGAPQKHGASYATSVKQEAQRKGLSNIFASTKLAISWSLLAGVFQNLKTRLNKLSKS